MNTSIFLTTLRTFFLLLQQNFTSFILRLFVKNFKRFSFNFSIQLIRAIDFLLFVKRMEMFTLFITADTTQVYPLSTAVRCTGTGKIETIHPIRLTLQIQNIRN